MSEKIDKLTGTPGANASGSYTAAAASLLRRRRLRGRDENGRGLRPRTGRRTQRVIIPPPYQLSCTTCRCGGDSAQPAPSTSATRWMRDGRRLRGSSKGKERRRKGWNGRPSWTDKARGRGVYVTVFIGGNRDVRPHKARSPRNSEVRERRGGGREGYKSAKVGGGEVGEGAGM